MANNKTALVTGGSRGIGFGIAEALLKQGYNVAITSRSPGRSACAGSECKRL